MNAIGYIVDPLKGEVFTKTKHSLRSSFVFQFFFLRPILLISIFNSIKKGITNLVIPFGGEWGIRTRGPFNKSTVFKTAAIDHSANSPLQK